MTSILKSKGPSSAYEIASRMDWDIVAQSWEYFPVAQKWFAIGEAIAHIRYLEDAGTVQRRQQNGTVLFYV